jgi:hypothetical protein
MNSGDKVIVDGVHGKRPGIYLRPGRDGYVWVRIGNSESLYHPRQLTKAPNKVDNDLSTKSHGEITNAGKSS